MSKTKKADAKRAAVYIRVSSEKQATRDKVSLPKQERLCREHAARMGWEVSAVYSDSGISGTKWDKREALMEELRKRAPHGGPEVSRAAHWLLSSRVVPILEERLRM